MDKLGGDSADYGFGTLSVRHLTTAGPIMLMAKMMMMMMGSALMNINLRRKRTHTHRPPSRTGKRRTTPDWLWSEWARFPLLRDKKTPSPLGPARALLLIIIYEFDFLVSTVSSYLLRLTFCAVCPSVCTLRARCARDVFVFKLNINPRLVRLFDWVVPGRLTSNITLPLARMEDVSDNSRYTWIYGRTGKARSSKWCETLRHYTWAQTILLDSNNAVFHAVLPVVHDSWAQTTSRLAYNVTVSLR